MSQIGANSVLLPGGLLAEGACLGAASMLNSKTETWSIYGGVPARRIGPRTKPKESAEDWVEKHGY